jgi:endo-1,4-beta-xylanase
MKMGTAVNLTPLFADEQYRNLALDQFSIWTPENSMKPQFIHPESNVYDFSDADQLVDAALKNNIAVHGHALVYDKSSPDWMTKSPVADRQQIMTDHINTVVSHFKGKVAEWDVVNEPFSEKHALYGFGKSGLEPNIWFQALGEKYIDIAFETAHKADPSAKLYLNDYGLENDGQRWDMMLGLVKRLRQRGVPIDGVGFESHVYTDGDYINAAQLKNHMTILARLGLSVRVSEIDVTGDDAKQQISQYVIALDVCLRSPNCTSYTTWGITDKYGSTTRSDRYPLVYGTSLLWDKDMKVKPAYGALQTRLQTPY